MNRLLLLSILILVTAPLAQAQQIPVTTNSDVARVQYVRGVHSTAHVDFDRARTHLDAALAADPSFAMAHVYRAVLSPAAAREEHMRQAGTGTASEGERQFIEAYAANLRGDYDREGALQKALAERFPNDPMPMFWWANTEYNRGNYAEAVAAAKRALAADPAFAPAYNMIGYTEMAAGNAGAAEQAFREQIRLAPDEANPYDSYGEFLKNQGRLDQAEAQFEMALTKDPAFEVSRDNLTRIAIMRATDAFVAAINDGDLDAYLDFYTANAVMSMPNGSELVGREAIREGTAPLFDSGASIAFDTKENTPMGDGFVYQRGALTTEINGVTEQGIATHIWAKTADGWKIARDIWTSAPVASASTD